MNQTQVKYLSFIFNGNSNKPYLVASEALAYNYPDKSTANAIRAHVIDSGAIADDLVVESILTKDGYVYRVRTAPVTSQLRQKLIAFNKAAQELTDAWTSGPSTDPDDLHDIAGSYPFPDSFDEVAMNINQWTRLAIGEIQQAFTSGKDKLAIYIDGTEVCEACNTKNSDPLILTACSGGATGDIFLCSGCFAEHVKNGDDNEGPCFDCVPPKGIYETKAYAGWHDAEQERTKGNQHGLTIVFAKAGDAEIHLTSEELSDYERSVEESIASDTYEPVEFNSLLAWLMYEELVKAEVAA